MRKLKRNIILFVLMPLADELLHTKIIYWYKQFIKMEKWTDKEITAWQTQKLRLLITHAYEHTHYYKELLDSLGLQPQDIRNIDDLHKIPPLTKELIRENFEKMKPDNIQFYPYKKASTGGSTGNPLQFILDRNSWGAFNAYNILAWEKTGYLYGETYAALGNSSIFPTEKMPLVYRLYYRLKGKIPIDAIQLSDEKMDKIISYIQRHHIHYLYGYASCLYLLAKHVEENNLHQTVKIKACFSTSEILTQEYRNCIERAFKCNLLDCYGAADGALVAYKYLEEGYAVGYNALAQIMDSETDFGPVLVTDLNNFAFPMIRYQLGDEIGLKKDKTHVYNGQIIEKLIGRSSDVIRLENGRTLTGPGFTVIFRDLPVKAYKIYKSDTLVINIDIVKAEGYTQKEESQIVKNVQLHTGDDCKINIMYVDNLSPNKNGKRLYFLN